MTAKRKSFEAGRGNLMLRSDFSLPHVALIIDVKFAKRIINHFTGRKDGFHNYDLMEKRCIYEENTVD